jgi:hypothetical protein
MPIRKSSVSGGSTPSGTTADRPANPSIGDTFFNGTLGVQEIYTTSGWLPATGANDFNIVLTGSETVVTLDKEYFSGAYTITSSLSDSSIDVYLFDTSNNSAGYTGGASISATNNFNKVVVYGGTVGDLLSFAYKTTFTTSTSTTETYAAPYITSIDNADLPNVDDTITITGGNFDTDIEVWFDGQNSYSQQAKAVVYGSSTSLVATRPDNLVEDNAPYTIRLINPNTTSPTSSNKHKVVDSVTAGGDPTWSTAAGDLPIYDINQPYSTTLLATDPDGGQITYSVVSGALPSGLALNAATGEISGTPSETGSAVIAATDPSGNVTNRSFSFVANFNVSGGTYVESGGYAYQTFTSSGTLEVTGVGTVDALIVAGGGAGGTGWYGGGGGAGGIVYATSIAVSTNSYSVEVGLGGTQSTTTQVNGGNGGNSSIFGYTAIGGGGGASRGNGDGNPGGSGGGFGRNGAGPTGQGGAALQPSSASGGYGNKGGNGGYGGGGGGAGAAGTNGGSSPPYGGNGGNGLNTWSAWATATSTGDNGYYAGGGGGGRTSDSASNGGQGGGGKGAREGVKAAENGLANTGGGGGGGTNQEQPASGLTIGTEPVGGAGGSGVVIIRYAI